RPTTSTSPNPSPPTTPSERCLAATSSSSSSCRATSPAASSVQDVRRRCPPPMRPISPPCAAPAPRRPVRGRPGTPPSTPARPPPPAESPFHRRNTPLAFTAYNIVPGLIGTLLTFTLVVVAALAVTRGRERGTMENLLAMPVRPLEVMVGKIVRCIFLGYGQV